MNENDHTDAELARRDLAYEMGEDTPEEKRYLDWCEDVARLMGVGNLDGDDEEDGYSLDEAYGLFLNKTPARDAAFYFIQKMQERQA